MAPTCPHWIWRVADSASLARSDRLQQLTSRLSSTECPSLVIVVGCRDRRITAKPKRQPDKLCLDLLTVGGTPLLVGTTSLAPRERFRTSCCHPGYEVATPYPQDAQAFLYSRLLYPFTDVFCFFAYEKRELERIAGHVGCWMQNNHPGIRRLNRPQLVIVLQGASWRHKDMVAVEFDSLLASITTHSLSEHFSEIDFVQPQESYSLLQHLEEKSQVVRECSKRAGLMFSVQHMNSLFERFFERVGTSPSPSFIKASREDFPVKDDMWQHVANFLKLLPSAKDLGTFGAEVVASSILLNNYPPDMHLFPPQDVFNTLYRAICFKAGKDAMSRTRPDGVLLPSAFSDSVMAHLNIKFQELRMNSSTEIHEATLSKFDWEPIESSDTCLVCLARVPQYTQSCGHGFCEDCLVVYCQSESRDPWLFRRQCCILCQKSVGIAIRVRPPTAGQSILCIDGGGVRGVLPLMMLVKIQEELGLPIPVQELFTMSYGTSVGALIILFLFMKGWSLEKCLVEYENLAAEVFKPTSGSVLSKWVRSLVSDALYPSEGIEIALKSAFGNHKLAGMSYASEVGAKFGLLAASVAQPLVNVFTNYNGVGDMRSGYQVPRGLKHTEAWEVGLSCSAAPLYFAPNYIKGFGSLQDAGMLQNNPIMMALSEFVALYGEDTPDNVVNLGTGSAPPSERLKGGIRKILDSWPFRVSRAVAAMMDGARSWDAYISVKKKTPKSDGHFRLDVVTPDLPSLDDTTKIPMLKSLVDSDKRLRSDIQKISRRLFASLFHFELTQLPLSKGNTYTIKGRLLCTRKTDDPALPPIIHRLASSTLVVNGKRMSLDAGKDLDGNISQSFTCSSGDMLSIDLMETDNPPYPISGSPYRVQRLLSRSGLAHYFGNSTHKRKAVEAPTVRDKRRRL